MSEYYNEKLGITESGIKSETDVLVLKRIMLDIEKEIISINAHLNNAKLKVLVDGEYSDSRWFVKTSGYKKTLGALKNICQFRLSELRTIEKQKDKENGDAFNRYLIQKLRESISEKKFEKILNQAKDEFFD